MILVLIGTVPLIIVNRIILISSASNELQSRIARVQAQWNIVVNQVSKSGYVDNPQNEVIDSELVQMANLQDGRALVVNRGFRGNAGAADHAFCGLHKRRSLLISII